MKQKELAMTLSKLGQFSSPDVKLEQYPTDSEVAAALLWQAKMLGDIDGKKVVDLGAGTGILGIGAAILGAKSVTMVEIDKLALERANENLQRIKDERDGQLAVKLECCDICSFNDQADTVIMNPPFGTKQKGADTKFLEKAVSLSNVVYSIHKLSTRVYVDEFYRKKGYAVTHFRASKMIIRATMPFHEKRLERIEVGIWRAKKASSLS